MLSSPSDQLLITITRYTVFVAALDISKAFDAVNHFKLFTSLFEAGIPIWIVNILANWYAKLS
jgi:hypothetical protein